MMQTEQRPKLEDIFVLDRDPAPLVIIDFHVYCWIVLQWYEGKVEKLVSEDVARKLVRAAWALLIQRGPDMLKRHSYRFLIVADDRYKDTGNYWRDRYMTESAVMQAAWVSFAESKGVKVEDIPTNYKGTRKDKTESFWFVFNEGWAYCQEYYGIHHCPGFEADDFAGMIYRASRDNPDEIVHKRQILLSTVDRDWTQLVDDDHRIYFANTRIPFPKEKIQERLVGNIGVIEHTAHRMGYELDHPKNLAIYKVKHGDAGDNLPPGSPQCLFDLIEPCELDIYNVEKQYERLADLWEDLNDPKPNDRPDHFDKSLRAMAKVGIEAPVRL